MQHTTQTTISGYPSRAATASDGMGDVRVFWLAAAIATLAVVAVVAFKLNGQDIRTTLFGNVTAWTQQMAPTPSKSAVAGRELALQAEPSSSSSNISR